MAYQFAQQATGIELAPALPGGNPHEPLMLHPLTDQHEREVLAFLAERPLHTVFMAGVIRDNGLSSALNRGSFYGCRNSRNELEGVSLLGHITLVETRNDHALKTFARFAQTLPRPNVILGEENRVQRFWQEFADDEAPRLISRDLLLEQRWACSEQPAVPALRTATLDDLYPVMSVHADLVMEETGINPMQTDPVGYRLRCARRIDQNRVWVWMQDGRVIFKADITCETPEVIYLEGVYVAPEARGKGYGSRCFAQLCRILLARVVSICLLVDEQNEKAQQLYFKTGFEVKSRYDSFFVNRVKQ